MGYILKASLALAVLATIGCGDSGGNRAPRGVVCGEKINPLPVDLNPKNEANKPQKLALTNQGEGISQYPGVYVYDGADIFYRNNKTNVQMQFGDVRNTRSKEKEFSLNVACVSGLSPGMATINFSEVGLSDIEVVKASETSSKITFGVRHYIIEFNKSKFPQKKAEKGDSSQFENPSKVYDGEASQYFFYKNAANNQTDFQTRAHYVNGDEQLDIVIRYKRTPPVAPAAGKDIPKDATRGGK